MTVATGAHTENEPGAGGSRTRREIRSMCLFPPKYSPGLSTGDYALHKCILSMGSSCLECIVYRLYRLMHLHRPIEC